MRVALLLLAAATAANEARNIHINVGAPMLTDDELLKAHGGAANLEGLRAVARAVAKDCIRIIEAEARNPQSKYAKAHMRHEQFIDAIKREWKC